MLTRTVGFCLSAKKWRKMNLSGFADLCRNHGIDVVQIDLSRPLPAQGPFDIIIHKLSDLMVEAQYNSQSQQLLASFQEYTAAHPYTVLLDPLPAMRKLLDRFVSYRIMGRLQTTIPGGQVCCPPYVEINTSDVEEIQEAISRHNLSFPFICKTQVAHGSSSHEMALIFNEEGLKDAHAPCILQSFINHNARLYKVFVVGSSHFTVDRPSLKNFLPGPSDSKTIFFNSHDVSKPESSSHLTELDKEMDWPGPPSEDVISTLVAELQAELGMSLFGVDVIINNETGRLTVIDINIFPGYEGVPEFFSALLHHIQSILKDPPPQGAAMEETRDLDHTHAPTHGPCCPVSSHVKPPSNISVTSTL
ncbi:inositol-tetrakisphosphate 1-kinase-like [Polypterus senegalus]|uniref:inositol-tetrakisphosphate 1-kinase-like n=1 Tax=Polypterus senegalus TaxID=55291 RepID=UPI001966703D|nr:inositol-tetrakisphosphate 1-kinase-like [Polypterus senegalus]